jgi:glutamate mutase epsilon subunit
LNKIQTNKSNNKKTKSKTQQSIIQSTTAINQPSLCIPRINSTITEKDIRNILDELKLGIIKRIDIKNTNTKNRCAFIHFNKWYEHGNGLIARERLLNGKDIKVIYDEPWFWKITAYRNKLNTTKND